MIDDAGKRLAAAADRDAAAGARAVFDGGQRALLFAAFAALVICRLPGAWLHGRFIDEEATVFLAYAWHRPWLDALFRPFGGYWNLAASASTVLLAALVRSGTVALERAPYVTMTIALAVQLIPAALLLTGRAAFLASRWAVVAALLFVSIMPATEEIFYNVLHIQFHLALCAALILALDPPERRGAKAGYAVLLFVAPLCGPGAIVVLPLFALRALVDRDLRRAAQTAVFAAGAAVQLLLFFGANPMRGHLLDPVTVAAAFFVRLLVLPLWGFPQAFHTGVAVYRSQAASGTGWWWAAAVAAVALGALAVIALRRRDAALWLVLAALALATSSFGYGMVIQIRFDLFSAGAGQRYNFVPLVLLALALVALARRYGPRRGFPLVFLCVFMLVVAARDYFRPLPVYAHGPAWTDEVAGVAARPSPPARSLAAAVDRRPVRHRATLHAARPRPDPIDRPALLRERLGRELPPSGARAGAGLTGPLTNRGRAPTSLSCHSPEQ